MKLNVHGNFTAPTMVAACFQDKKVEDGLFPENITSLVNQMLDNKEFEPKPGAVHSLHLQDNTPRNIILLGLGKEDSLTLEKARRYAATAVKAGLNKTPALDIPLACFGSKLASRQLAMALAEAVLLAAYKFDTYKTECTPPKLETVNLVGSGPGLAEGVDEGQLLAQCTLLARRLVNEPANIMTPARLASEAEETGKKYGFKVAVYGDDKIYALGMQAFAAVARASENRPRLIVMRYNGNPDSNEVLGLVGKGLTYDSGGLSVKPTTGMSTMKCDMGGAAAVIGAMAAIASRKLKLNAVAVIAACENLISGNSYKPGDIIGSMAGKSIEVLNTDAEGRLTLADAVHYCIDQEKATRIVDVATLTGAAVVALGKITTAVVASEDEFYTCLEQAADLAGERIWRLPGDEEYKKDIESDVADLKNIGEQVSAGAIAGTLFVGAFTQGLPWLHLDIAGTAWAGKEQHYQAKGGTGVAVRTLYHLAALLA